MSLLQEFCILLLGAGWGGSYSWLLFLLVSFLECGLWVKMPRNCAMKLKSELLFDYGDMTCDLRLFSHSSSSPKTIHNGVVDYSTDRPWTHLALSINWISNFCSQFQLFALKNSHVQYTQTDTIRQTDGPLVPMVRLVPMENDAFPMVLLVQNKFAFTPSKNVLIIIMNIPRSIRQPRKTSSLLHQVKARYNSYEYSSFCTNRIRLCILDICETTWVPCPFVCCISFFCTCFVLAEFLNFYFHLVFHFKPQNIKYDKLRLIGPNVSRVFGVNSLPSCLLL